MMLLTTAMSPVVASCECAPSLAYLSAASFILIWKSSESDKPSVTSRCAFVCTTLRKGRKPTHVNFAPCRNVSFQARHAEVLEVLVKHLSFLAIDVVNIQDRAGRPALSLAVSSALEVRPALRTVQARNAHSQRHAHQNQRYDR